MIVAMVGGAFVAVAALIMVIGFSYFSLGTTLLADAAFGLRVGCETIPLCGAPSNKRLKLAARVDEGMNLSSARRSLSAIR